MNEQIENLKDIVDRVQRRPLTVYTALVTSWIRELLRDSGKPVDQHQSNGLFCVHQLRVRHGDQVYRVLIAPAHTPISIGNCPVDEHFNEHILVD